MYPFEKIEKKWAKKWLDTKIYEPDLDKAKKPYYNLMMFPYPSAEGLHIGAVRTFSGVDVYGRFMRMQGHDVFEPIGLDGFGIHSENYALKVGKHPLKHAEDSEKNFYRQLGSIGNGFAWNDRLETYDPDYYKWTQWIFIQMWKHGLVERKKASLNWCPSCKTVLADEQVIGGKCERCETEVTKKNLEQWFFKITKYADKLLGNLEKIDWSEHVKIAQRNWIGKSVGARLTFPIKGFGGNIEVFTTRPDTLFGATYMVLAPEHELVEKLKDRITNWKEVEGYIKKTRARTENERITEAKSKTGVGLEGVKAINPANKKEIPVWIADYVLASYGTGAIMAVPEHDERDYEFAKKFKLPVAKTKLVDKWEITKKVGGKKEVNYHLRDWLISRQRYWGPPIPMIHCEECGWQPVPEKDLPVLLPDIKDFRPKGTGESPLASEEAFWRTKCPECGGEARRETDVSDTFLDSAWYFFRYPGVDNKKEAFSKSRLNKWLPVDMYIGGAEHAVLHLLYSRFITMAFKDMGLTDFEEPFTKFRTHGLITLGGAKMSKSKGNVVDPDDYIGKFGADAVRVCLQFISPLPAGGVWQDSGLMGAVRFLNRVWKIGEKPKEFAKEEEISPWMHKSIKKVTDDIEELKYNTAIAELMIVSNRFEKEGASREDFKTFLLLLAPFAPFITEELWSRFFADKKSRIHDSRSESGQTAFKSIHKEPWPKYEEKYLVEDTINLIVQVNGKFRATIETEKGVTQKEAEKLALAEESVSRHIKSKPNKVVFVKGKLINFVI